MDDAKLIGWLCMMRLHWSADRPAQMPSCVSKALAAKGWITVSSDVDWEGDHSATITDAGWAITDLHGADWGIDTIPSESEAGG